MSVRRNEVSEAPLRILGPATRQLMSTRLDSRKILLTSQGIHRDWRGLAEQAHLDVNSISSGKISPTEHCIHLWGKRLGTIGQLWTFLEAMDRFDVIDDTLLLIYEDYDRCKSQVGGIMTTLPPPMEDNSYSDPDVITTDDQKNLNLGLGLQHYDALVLSADEDCDFVQELVEKLEGEYGLKLCLKDRDLVGGLQFETESIVRLIIERCARVIVVLSPEFLASNVNNFFTSFAHALSIDQRRRIVIPCQLRPCTKPPVISFCHSLDYYRAKGYWNYWEKLRDSLTIHSQAVRRPPSIEPQDRIQEISSSSTVALSPESPNTPSPSQSLSFFSKFLRKSDSKGKGKLVAASESSSHQASKMQSPDVGLQQEQKMSSDVNGHPCSSAIPIHKSANHPIHRSVSSASGDSSDFTNILGDLPDVPETPPISPLSTTSSVALLLPEITTPSPRSRSKILDIFKGKSKRKDS